MAVQRGSYCTVKIQQHPIAVNSQVFYSHAYSDWIVLDVVVVAITFNERVDGSSPSSLNFLSSSSDCSLTRKSSLLHLA
ncbi:MAG: hypothetical protein K2X08_06670 [Chlamydiales bacterium]|nr:hypothetical protein [Chlamydiales bacterium]